MKIKIVLIVPLIMLSLLCSGCWALWMTGGAVVGAGAGVAGTAYVEGKLKGHLNHNPEEVALAAEKVFKNLGITETSKSISALESKIVGRTVENDEVKVWADATGPGGSDITIRIGWFGDETKSRLIYEEISKQFPPPNYNTVKPGTK